MSDLSLLVQLLQLVVNDRTHLALENIALRHQLAVYKRSLKRLVAVICVGIGPEFAIRGLMSDAAGVPGNGTPEGRRLL